MSDVQLYYVCRKINIIPPGKRPYLKIGDNNMEYRKYRVFIAEDGSRRAHVESGFHFQATTLALHRIWRKCDWLQDEYKRRTGQIAVKVTGSRQDVRASMLSSSPTVIGYAAPNRKIYLQKF